MERKHGCDQISYCSVVICLLVSEDRLQCYETSMENFLHPLDVLSWHQGNTCTVPP